MSIELSKNLACVTFSKIKTSFKVKKFKNFKKLYHIKDCIDFITHLKMSITEIICLKEQIVNKQKLKC